MQLDRAQACFVRHSANRVFELIHEHPHLLDCGRQMFDNSACCFWPDATRAPLIKHKSEGIRACIDGGQRVLKICNPANFHPGHEDSSASSSSTELIF